MRKRAGIVGDRYQLPENTGCKGRRRHALGWRHAAPRRSQRSPGNHLILTESGVRFRSMIPADPKSPRATTSRPFRWLTGILTGILLAMLVIGAALWARSE